MRRGLQARAIRLVAICLLFNVVASADTFTKHKEIFLVGPNPEAIIARDLNGDDLTDIVTTDVGAMTDPREEIPASDELSLLLGRGNLEFIAQPPLTAGYAPYCVTALSIDRENEIDLIAGSFMAVGANDITLFRGIGENHYESIPFSVSDERLTYTKMKDSDDRPVFTIPGITSLVVRDFNKDGLPDVAAAGWSSDVLVLWPGMTETYFGEPKLVRAAGGPRDVQAYDFDNDGNLDIAAVLYSAGAVQVWKGDGKGEFTSVCRFLSRGRLPTRLRVADVNQDGKPDMVISHCHADDSIVIFYGDEPFTFPMSQEIVLGKDTQVIEYELRDLAVGRLNGDSREDIAVAACSRGEVVVLINESASSSLPQSFRRETYAYASGKPRALCIEDINRDGAVDLGVALWDANAVALLLGKVEKPPQPDKKPQAK